MKRQCNAPSSSSVKRATSSNAYSAAAAAYSGGPGDCLHTAIKDSINDWLALLALTTTTASASAPTTTTKFTPIVLTTVEAASTKATPPWALLLETSALRTLGALERAFPAGWGWPSRTVVPQPDPTEHAAMAGRIAHPMLATSHSALERLLAGDAPADFPGFFSFVYLDYCGAASRHSRAGRARLADLEALLCGGLLRPPAILAVTASARGTNQLYPGEGVDLLAVAVEDLARRSGLVCTPVGTHSYEIKATMHTSAWLVSTSVGPPPPSKWPSLPGPAPAGLRYEPGPRPIFSGALDAVDFSSLSPLCAAWERIGELFKHHVAASPSCLVMDSRLLPVARALGPKATRVIVRSPHDTVLAKGILPGASIECCGEADGLRKCFCARDSPICGINLTTLDTIIGKFLAANPDARFDAAWLSYDRGRPMTMWVYENFDLCPPDSECNRYLKNSGSGS